MNKNTVILWMVGLMSLTACVGKSNNQPVVRPDFSADTAYQYIAQQVQFGARVPNTKQHRLCAAYLAHQLREAGAEVNVQQGQKINYAGQAQSILNIVGHFSGDEGAEAVLLCAHYDTRPWSDEEDVYANRFIPMIGANDGASGVGVLLEVARQIGLKRAAQGKGHTPIDIVFFDCEDMGTPDFYTGAQRTDTWCLGSQLWSEEVKKARKKYEYGILLDMVGAPGAMFPKEYYSTQVASNYVEKIWRQASKLGYQNYFVSTQSLPIVDDHYYIAAIAGIPCVDIIHYDAQANSFPYWWHTQQDNLNQINLSTLQAVGETILSCLNY